jgi:hypothetical protein
VPVRRHPYARADEEDAMTGSRRTARGRGAEWKARRPGGAWRDAWGALPILVALALWGWALAGVLAPLSGALARIDSSAREAPAAAPCGVPPGALASAAAAVDPRGCR